MTDLAKQIIAEQSRLASERANYDTRWQQIAERCCPDLAVFNTVLTPGAARTDKQFDSTAALASTSFAAAIMDMITPREKKLHNLRSGIPELDESPRVKLYFEQVRDILFYHRYSPRANFANQFYNGLLSMGLFGPAAMWVDEIVGGGLVYRNVHVSEICIEEDEHGRVNTVYRRARLAARKWGERWGKTALPRQVRDAISSNQSHREFEFIHCIRPRANVDPSRMDARGMRYESIVVSVSDSEIVRRGGFHSMPLLVSRFTALSNAKYGRSPAMQVLPDIKMANEMQKTLLRAAHRATSPPLLVHDDGVLTKVSLKPDAINIGGLDHQGRQMVQPLHTGGSINVGMEMVQAAREVVERAFLVPLFSILTDTPDRMTATEVLERAREKGALLSPAAGMIEGETLGPMIEREIDLLARAGRLPPMPPELVEAEGEYRIGYENPLQRAARSERSIGFLRTVEAVAPIAAAKPEVWDEFDLPAAVRGLAEDSGVPQLWMKDPAQREAERAAQAEQQQAMQMLEGASIAGDAAAKFAQLQEMSGAAGV